MIRLVIFDLDGTLVKTEALKALSYARAVIELCPNTVQTTEVIEAFKEVVGRSRREVALALMKRFDLERAARSRLAEFGVSAPWQAFVQIRLAYYEKMLNDPLVILNHRWPYTIALLEEVRRMGCKTGMATMSHCNQVQQILKILNLSAAFDFIATGDDIDRGKPDPQIYRLVSSELDIAPADCLVIEDSPAGVRAALAAGMHCFAVTTPFTRDAIHSSHLLSEDRIVDDPAKLVDLIGRFLEEHQN